MIFQCCAPTESATNLTTVMTNIIVDKGTVHDKPLSICIFSTVSTSKFLSHPCLRADKGIARHVDASSVVCNLIDNGKLVNQIATLLLIVVKKWIEVISYLWNDLGSAEMGSQLNKAWCKLFFHFRYQVMRDCWNANPSMRPTFDGLIVRLESTITT